LNEKPESGRATHNNARKKEEGSSGEFDPGSERTLAACLIHASRMRGFLSGE
jgi:hypothetical protein